MSRKRAALHSAILAVGVVAVGPASATILNFEVTRSDGHSEADWDKYYGGGAQTLQAYGDNVNFGAATTGSTLLPDGPNTFTLNYAKGNGWTPNVTVTYSQSVAPASPPQNGDGIGRVNDPTNPWGTAGANGPGGGGVAWLDHDTVGGNTGHFYFAITPDPGYAVRFNSYDLINYSFGGHGTDITVYQDTIGGTAWIPQYVDNNVPSGPGLQYHYDVAGVNPGFYPGTLVLDVQHLTGTNWTLALDNLDFEQIVVPTPGSWVSPTSGDWADASNWASNAIPNGVGAAAKFLGAISSPQTVFTNTAVTVGSLTFNNVNEYMIGGAGSLTLSVSSGSASVDVLAGSHSINLPLILASNTTLNAATNTTLRISDPVTVNSGVNVTQPGSGLVLYESTVALQSGATLQFGNSNHIAGLTVASAATATLMAGNNKTLRTDTLSVSGRVDLKDNRLITSAAVGSWNGSSYTGVTGLVDSGRGTGNTWNGTTGITTSQTSATNGSNFTSIGVAQASDVRPNTATATALWNGQTISGGDTLVMYTYGGDATLDGKLNIDDYVRIDQGIAANLKGWSNGDFNYDGKVNIDDYTTVIDSNIGTQGAPLGSASGGESLSGATAVPEPVGAVTLGLGLVATGLRRRRSTACR